MLEAEVPLDWEREPPEEPHPTPGKITGRRHSLEPPVQEEDVLVALPEEPLEGQRPPCGAGLPPPPDEWLAT